MSYIEKEKAIKADLASIENRVRHAFNQGYDLGYKEGKATASNKAVANPGNMGEIIENLEAISKALEQESRKDEVILTKEEYGELVSNEFDNGYAKGYREALEQELILDKIRAEIKKSSHGKWYVGRLDGKTEEVLLLDEVLQILDKYKGESEE